MKGIPPTAIVCLLNLMIHIKTAVPYAYKIEEIDPGQWALHIYEDFDDKNSFIECGAICDRDIQCGAFQYSKSSNTCALATKDYNSILVSDTGTTIKVHAKIYEKIYLSEGEEAVPTEVKSADNKILWQAVASSTWSSGYVSKYAVDGTASKLWHNKGGGALHSWLQVKMDQGHWVKGVKIGTRASNANRQKYTEIRIGNTDVSESPEDELLCQNQLCYMLGNDNTNPLYFDCVTPMWGQYITVQQYNKVTSPRYMECNEVDVTIFTGPFRTNENIPCNVVEVDYCANRALIKSNTELASTLGQKSNWELKSSSKASNEFDLAVLVDGVTSGTLAAKTIFSTKEIVDDKYPWIQVDMKSSKVVKAVHLHSRTDFDVGEHILFVEVRVGDIDASQVTQTNSRICVNALCKVTGGKTPVPKQDHDCTGGSPLKGQFVTIQRYDTKLDNNGDPLLSSLVLAEVDVELYV